MPLSDEERIKAYMETTAKIYHEALARGKPNPYLTFYLEYLKRKYPGTHNTDEKWKEIFKLYYDEEDFNPIL